MSAIDPDSPWAPILHPERVKLYGVELEARARTAKLFTTGMSVWDTACDDTGGGLDDYWYVVIGGASNVGKTQVAVALAKMALTQGFSVAFFTMEEPIEQIQRRVYASLGALGYYDFTYSRFTHEKARLLCESVPNLGTMYVNEDLPSYHDLWGGNAMYSNPSQVFMLDHTAKSVDRIHPHIVRLWGLLDKNRYGPGQVAMMVEANLKTGTWRCAEPDEHPQWLPNPWAKTRPG
jgi:hypothetical protein